MRSINIAIFASGNGSNAESIIKYFQEIADIKVKLILTNNPDAFVVRRVRKLQVDHFIFSRNDFYDTNKVNNVLKEYSIDFIVLAGFLWLVPASLIKQFPDRIINIHPALLPKYGGKGMYGARVHQSVKDSKDKFTGITIHFVNDNYDEGDIIFQAKCPVLPEDTIEDIQESVHSLEHEHFPVIIEKTIRKAFKK